MSPMARLPENTGGLSGYGSYLNLGRLMGLRIELVTVNWKHSIEYRRTPPYEYTGRFYRTRR